VVIESGDCGRFVLREGVTADNGDDIASGVEIGEKYDLAVGDGSLEMRGSLRVSGASLELLGYRRS
jgi:hypothetical protein